MKKTGAVLFFSLFAVAGVLAQTKAEVKEITEVQFEEIVGTFDAQGTFKGVAAKPVVVDFYATWCGPCKKLAPIMEELAKENAGKIEFYKVDVDKNQSLAAKVQVRSIPMLMFFPADGGEPQSIVGLYPKEEIVKAMNYVFKP